MVLRMKRFWWLLAATAVILGGRTALAMETTPAVAASAMNDVSASAVVPSGSGSALGWVLIAAFFAMFTQSGFALVETGLCRAKNAAHTMSMTLMIYAFGCLGFWAYGFALGWGDWMHGPVAVAPGWGSSLGPDAAVLNHGWGLGAASDGSTGAATGAFLGYGLIGLKGFFLNGVNDAGALALFFFMMVLMNVAATIPTGAMAERWRWKSFCLYGLWVALPCSVFAHWVWGGGWLAQMGVNWNLGHGAVDFAGSGVVHAMGGIIGLAGVMVLGPRIGKYSLEGKPLPLPAHHLPMVVVGTLILTVGWFGFSSGAAFAGAGLRGSAIVVNTALAGVAGAMVAMFTLQLKGLKPDTTILCNGMLSGLAAISAPCAFVDSWAAALIGAIAGVLVVYSVFYWERHHIDDPVGAISVHGINGLWGVISVGIFANGKYGAGWNGVVRDSILQGVGKDLGYDGVRGVLYGDASQLAAQLVDVAVLAFFGFCMAYAWFVLSNRITPMRASRETELAGLDGPEMGVVGYSEFALVSRRS
jgi:ammonium transporter, Amt family